MTDRGRDLWSYAIIHLARMFMHNDGLLWADAMKAAAAIPTRRPEAAEATR